MLRPAFAALFGLQVLAAALVSAALLPFRAPDPRPGSWLGPVLIGLALAQGLLAAYLHGRAVRHAARPAARPAGGPSPRSARGDGEGGAAARRAPRPERSAGLAAALLGAGLLATPAWFAAFAWLAGVGAAHLAVLLALLGLYYGVGMARQGTLARRVSGPGPPR